MAKIVSVRCDAHTDTAVIEGWTVAYSNGKQETYSGEIPPAFIARFCRTAKHGCKTVDGTSVADWYTK